MKRKTQNHLLDKHRRKVNYLRISVTDRCNLNCRYCAPSLPKIAKGDAPLTLEEIHRLATVATGLGITKIRLTGGEPLFRRGITSLVESLGALPGLSTITLTTNGILLAEKVRGLREAGMNRVNISLDTLRREKFRELTGRDGFDAVWRGIRSALDAGMAPIKINTVVMRGFNDDEVMELAALSLRYPFRIRFIEYMPIGTDPKSAGDFFVPIAEIKERLAPLGSLIPVRKDGDDGPAERFRLAGAPGEVGFIGSMSRHFCHACNRLRLTSKGGLRPCLLADRQIDLAGPLRGGADDETLAELFREALAQKGSEHNLNFGGDEILQTKMVSIGG